MVASAKECLHPFTGTLAGKLHGAHAPNGPLGDFTLVLRLTYVTDGDDRARNGVSAGGVARGWLTGGGRWGDGAIVVHFQMPSFLVLTSTSPPIKQAGKLAFWGVFSTRRPHRKAPLRGATVR